MDEAWGDAAEAEFAARVGKRFCAAQLRTKPGGPTERLHGQLLQLWFTAALAAMVHRGHVQAARPRIAMRWRNTSEINARRAGRLRSATALRHRLTACRAHAKRA